MIFKKSAMKTGGAAPHGLGFGSSAIEEEWRPAPKPRTDWKKVLLLTGLGTLSWISTYTGMLELIQANMGGLSLTMKVAVGFAVAMLMLMIVWLLDQLFDRINLTVRSLFIFGYLFLTLISVGFGFGFYWKFLESRSEASRSAESAVTQVQTALEGAQTRLEQLQTTLASLTAISKKKAIEERDKGNSCPNSRPGDGPRRRLRDSDAASFGFASTFVQQRVGTVKNDISVLNQDLAKVASRDKSTISVKDGTRNAFMRSLSRKLDRSVARFNAFRSDPQLTQFRSDFAERANKTIFPNGKGGTFTCPDPELQTALRGVVRAIDKLPDLEKPRIATVEGSEAIIEAFRRLTTTLYGALKLEMPPTPDELRAAQQRAVQSIQNAAAQRHILNQQPGLGERDYIPLFIALFVDFCLLLVSVSRPMNGFQWLDHKMGQAQEWPVIKILSRFRDIHKDEEIREVFDVFRHVVFDWRGVYYAAIPLNGTDPTYEGRLSSDAAMQAQLLSNLFTSFENDKVFTRVPLSLFTNSFLQRKLREQGSKFSEAEAFRIYRFRREMWQDWMLSAMMGAAKRVEARKHKEAMEADLFGPIEPKLAAPANENESDDGDTRGRANSANTASDGVHAATENEAADDALSAAVADAISETLETARARKHRETARRAASATATAAGRVNGAEATLGANVHPFAVQPGGRVATAHAGNSWQSGEPVPRHPGELQTNEAATAHANGHYTNGHVTNGHVNNGQALNGNRANGFGSNGQHANGVGPGDPAGVAQSGPAPATAPQPCARDDIALHRAANSAAGETRSLAMDGTAMPVDRAPNNATVPLHAPQAADHQPDMPHQANVREVPAAPADDVIHLPAMPPHDNTVEPGNGHDTTFRRRVRSELPSHMAPLAAALVVNVNTAGIPGERLEVGMLSGAPAPVHAPAQPTIDVIADSQTEVIPRRPGDDLEMAALAIQERQAWQDAGPEWQAEQLDALAGPDSDHGHDGDDLEHRHGDDGHDDNDDDFDWDQPDIEIGSITQWFRKGDK